ncbi:MAG: thioredoxin family protein [Bacteroidota bacterium]
MALTESTMLPLGTTAPDFNLPDTISGKTVTFDNAGGVQIPGMETPSIAGSEGTLVYFICNHCPYVIHTIEELVRIAAEYQQKGVGAVAISSNDIERYPDDSPEKMRDFAHRYQFTFPYLYDESQDIARAYAAACTPDIYLFNADGELYYRGRLDASRPGNDTPITGEDLRIALDSLLAGKPAPEKQIPSAGCGIKWK